MTFILHVIVFNVCLPLVGEFFPTIPYYLQLIDSFNLCQSVTGLSHAYYAQ